MTLFVVLAALMVSAGLALIAWPLYRARTLDGRAGWLTLSVAVIALPLAALVLYRLFSNWDWDPQVSAAAATGQHSMQEAIAALEGRLKTNPDDIDGWLMLGRTRLVMNDAPNAVRAYQRAYEISKGGNFEATLGYAATLARSDPSAIQGRVGELSEEALKLQPTNPEALYFGGAAARANGRLPLARERWMAVLKSGAEMPAEFRAQLIEQVRELDRALNAAPDPELARLAQASPTVSAPPAAAPATAGASVTVHVRLSPAVAAKVPPGALLFVLARDPTQPGPPFAAKRYPGAQLPLAVVLTEQDAMLPGRTIRSAHQLIVVARFSSSGAPTAASGDVYGEVAYDLAQTKPADLVIDKLVP